MATLCDQDPIELEVYTLAPEILPLEMREKIKEHSATCRLCQAIGIRYRSENDLVKLDRSCRIVLQRYP